MRSSIKTVSRVESERNFFKRYNTIQKFYEGSINFVINYETKIYKFKANIYAKTSLMTSYDSKSIFKYLGYGSQNQNLND